MAGGSDGFTQLNTLYIYDIASNTWTTSENHLPVAEEAGGSAVLQNKLYVFGGLPPFIMTQIYDPARDTWSPGPNLNIDRFRFYATAVGNNSILALGGQNAVGGALDAPDADFALWWTSNEAPRFADSTAGTRCRYRWRT